MLRGIYRRLPIVRELTTIRGDQLAIVDNLRKLVALERERRIEELLRLPRYDHPGRLNRHEARVFSQNGEDGLIAEILRRIGTTHRRFAEISVGDGWESNTTTLLLQGWGGLWVEGNPALVDGIRRDFANTIASGRLRFVEAFATPDNVESLLDEAGLPEDLDVLSLDVDYGTYWLWHALRRHRPRLVVVEYNALFPPPIEWTVPGDDPRRCWDEVSFEYGASLQSLDNLARERGYSLVACDVSGTNAFFARSDLVEGRFAGPFTPEFHHEPCRAHLLQREGYVRKISNM